MSAFEAIALFTFDNAGDDAKLRLAKGLYL
jgi:hypothetical protein